MPGAKLWREVAAYAAAATGGATTLECSAVHESPPKVLGLA